MPHPPGYPLFVVLIRLLKALGADANHAMIWISLAFTALACGALFRFAETCFGRRGAVFIAALLLFSPGVLLHNTIATTYSVDLWTSAAGALFARELWLGRAAFAVPAMVFLGVMAGVRESGAVLMLPLLAIAMLRGRVPARRALLAALAGGVSVVCWYAPAALASGGFEVFRTARRQAMQAFLADSSVLFGAPAARHWAMVFDSSIWLLMNTAVPALLALAALAYGREPEPEPAEAPRSLGLLFYAAWLLPNLAYVFGVHSPKPGYLMLSLPPLLLLLGSFAHRRLLGAGPLSGRSYPHAAPGIALGVAVLVCVGIASADYTPLKARWPRAADALGRGALASVAESDCTLSNLRSLLEAQAVSGADWIVTNDGRRAGPNYRKLSYYFTPRLRVVTFGERGELVQALSPSEELMAPGKVPAKVRRIWWITEAEDSLEYVRHNVLVDTRLVARGSSTWVWQSDVGEGYFQLDIPWAGGPVRIFRGSASRLEHFADLEHDRGQSWIWALGPRSHVRLTSAAGDRVRLLLQASASAAQEATLRISVGALELVRLKPVVLDYPFVVEFSAEGTSTDVELAVEPWPLPQLDNADPRPLAVAFQRLAVSTGSEQHELVPYPATPDPTPSGPQRRIVLSNASAAEWVGAGFSGAEPGHRWTEARAAELRFPVPAPGPVWLKLHGSSFGKQRVRLSVNEHPLAAFVWNGSEPAEFSCRVPQEILQPDNRLTLELPDAKSPRSMGINDDPRLLALALKSLDVSAASRAGARP